MSDTIDEIQERLAPSRLLHDATASVRDAGRKSVRRALSQAGRTARQAQTASAAAAGCARTHPLSATLVAAGVGLVLVRRFIGSRHAAMPTHSWLARNALAVGAAVVAAGTAAGVSWTRRRTPMTAAPPVTR